MTVSLPPIPNRMQGLPIDHRGYPIPWFVAMVNGKPEFRLGDSRKLILAVSFKACWVCGKRLKYLRKDRYEMVFVAGPMAAMNRVTAEPPAHPECAEFSVKACPFLLNPSAVRREANLPPDTGTAGIQHRANPGVMLLWHADHYTTEDDHQGYPLIQLPDPIRLEWWKQGRAATRAESLDVLASRREILIGAAAADARRNGLPEGVDFPRVEKMYQRALKWVPKE